MKELAQKGLRNIFIDIAALYIGAAARHTQHHAPGRVALLLCTAFTMYRYFESHILPLYLSLTLTLTPTLTLTLTRLTLTLTLTRTYPLP